VPAFLFLSLPLAAWQAWAVAREAARPAAWSGIAFRGIALFVAASALQLAAFALQML